MTVPFPNLPPPVDIPVDIPEGEIIDIRGFPTRVPVPGWFPLPEEKRIVYGSSLNPSWSDVWDWTKNSASTVLGWFQSPPSVSEATVQRIVETFVGESQKAITSFIDDAVNFASYGLNAVNAYAHASATMLLEDLQSLALDLGNLMLRVVQIEEWSIPSLLTEIIRLGASIDPKILQGMGMVERWALDNIFKPLYEDIGQAEAQARDYTNAWVAAALNSANAYTLASIAPIWSAISKLQAAQLAQEALNNDCTTPMCDVMGPRTDLGKFLKKLNFAATALLLAELAALDADGIESLLRGFQSIAGGVVDDFEAIFTGGETIGGAIAHAGG